MFGSNLRKPFQCPIAFGGEDKLGVTSIFRASFSFNEAFGSELVDQNNHAAWKHAKLFGEAKLITAGVVGDEADDAGMRTSETKRSNPSFETFGRVSAELGKEKRRTGVRSFARTHR